MQDSDRPQPARAIGLRAWRVGSTLGLANQTPNPGHNDAVLPPEDSP